jgi:protein-S-isoprenylcysteine O-methyltransferase Ste14
LTALHTPKENQSEQPEHLVTNKLYHWMRHPIYTCILVFLLCTPMMSWNKLAFLIGMAVYMIIGASLEEKKMLKEFGEAYTEYRKNTPMFLPVKFR